MGDQKPLPVELVQRGSCYRCYQMTQAGVPGIGVELMMCELEHLLETVQAGVPGM